MTRTGKAAEADVAYVDAGETLRQAGHLMRELEVEVLVVRGENGEIQGTISRDMVVQRIAAGGDPRTVTVGEVASRRRPALLVRGRARRLWPGPWRLRPCKPGGPWPPRAGSAEPAHWRHSLRWMSDQVLSH